MSNPAIRSAIDKALAAQVERVEVKADDILRELLRILRTDIGDVLGPDGALLAVKDMPVDVRRAVSSIEVSEEQVDGVAVGEIKKLKFWDKPRAAELLGKHLKLWTDKVEHSGEVKFAEALKEARDRARR